MQFLIFLAITIVAAASAFPQPQPVPEIEGRITNGIPAASGQFPYQVGLSLKKSASSTSWCGGSLISNEWVLTAAHCTDGAQSVTVYLGATIRTSAEVTQTIGKANIITHSGWNSKNLNNDISLIKIDYVSFTSKIQAVRLPSSASSTYVGSSVIASGWGRQSDSKKGVVNDLQYAALQIISNTVCAYTYGSTTIISSVICCSTPDHVSTCNGDSGGPIVLESNGVQIGLSSFGATSGCEKGKPVAFTRITSYLEWIKSNTGVSY